MGLFDGTPLERPITCEHCTLPMDECRCPRNVTGALMLARDQRVRVHREKRRGKWTTVVSGLDPCACDLPAMLKRFKRLCSAGGGLRDDGLELQGDHRDRLLGELREMGFSSAKAAGG